MSLLKMCSSPTESPRKSCGEISRLWGVVDFSGCAADHAAIKKVEPYSGVTSYYYRCDQCGSAFTRAFHSCTPQDVAQPICNADYERNDPDYKCARPIFNANLNANSFPETVHGKMLDFGSGLGLLEHELRARGLSQVTSNDPYAADENASALSEKYQAVGAFEVFEHHPDPHTLMDMVARFIAEDRANLFRTLTFTDDVVETGTDKWRYCAPRNGHISFFTSRSIATITARHGLRAGSFNAGSHFFYRHDVPA